MYIGRPIRFFIHHRVCVEILVSEKLHDTVTTWLLVVFRGKHVFRNESDFKPFLLGDIDSCGGLVECVLSWPVVVYEQGSFRVETTELVNLFCNKSKRTFFVDFTAGQRVRENRALHEFPVTHGKQTLNTDETFSNNGLYLLANMYGFAEARAICLLRRDGQECKLPPVVRRTKN